jgi:hypothetical protein
MVAAHSQHVLHAVVACSISSTGICATTTRHYIASEEVEASAESTRMLEPHPEALEDRTLDAAWKPWQTDAAWATPT